jgi:hypothetical protein
VHAFWPPGVPQAVSWVSSTRYRPLTAWHSSGHLLQRQHSTAWRSAIGMSHPGFGHLWCDDELSDCDIVLYVDSSTLEDPHPVVLRTVPGQKSILTASPYCKAQVSRA